MKKQKKAKEPVYDPKKNRELYEATLKGSVELFNRNRNKTE